MRKPTKYLPSRYVFCDEVEHFFCLHYLIQFDYVPVLQLLHDFNFTVDLPKVIIV